MASLLNMSSSRLLNFRPYDAEIEYLESSGTQYIDTGYKPSNLTSIEVVACFSSDYFICSGYDGMYVDIAILAHNVYKVYTGRVKDSDHSNKDVKSNISITNPHKMTFYISQSEGFIIDGIRYGGFNNYTFISPYNLYVFAMNDRGQRAVSYGKGKIYKLYIRDNGVLVMDFIPVRIGTTGYLYDKVSGQLFGNAGTGSFILGPDKTN